MTSQRRILFVDDEINVLQGLRRSLRAMRKEWEMVFAGGGDEALVILKSFPCDVVVTDMKMPGMDGAELLAEIAERHPSMVRVVLSGQSEKEALVKALGTAHQFLAKPLDAERLKSVLGRAFLLRDLLANEALQSTLPRLNSLPSLPSLYRAILAELQGNDPSIRNIGKIVARDAGMSAKILQVVNSVVFAPKVQITDAEQATIYVGIELIKALVLSVKIFDEFDDEILRRFSMEAIYDHSFRVAGLTQKLARGKGLDRRQADHAFLAGLLHDLGKGILAENLSDDYAKVRDLVEQGIPDHEAEKRVLGISHCEIGSYVVGIWGLPDAILDAILHHHRGVDPRADPDPKMVLPDLVGLADLLDHDVRHPVDDDRILAPLQAVGPPEAQLDTWRETARAIREECASLLTASDPSS